MAIVKEIQYPNGVLVRIHDDCLEKDQKAAWAAAYAVAAEIHWQHVREAMQAGRSKESGA